MTSAHRNLLTAQVILSERVEQLAKAQEDERRKDEQRRREAAARDAETDRRIKDLVDEGRRLDERIGGLVSAIGELIHRKG